MLLPYVGAAQSAPLDRAEILGRLTQGDPASFVAHLVKTRGVSFSPSANFLSAVKLAGGDGILLERLSASDLVSTISPTAPDRPFSHFARCSELLYVGDNEQAQPECLAAIDENPESAWPIMAAFHASKALGRGNSEQDNIALLRRAIALDPDMISAHRALFGAGLSPEERTQEMQNLAALQQVEQSDGYASATGYLEYPSSSDFLPPENKDFLRTQMQVALQKYPDLAAIHMAVGLMFASLGDPDKLNSEAQEAFRLEPGNPKLHISLAGFYLSQHNTEAELAEYREGIRRTPYDESLREVLVEALVREQRTDDAIREWKDYLALCPRNVAASDALVELYLQGQDRKSAIAELRRSLKGSSDAAADQAKFVKDRIVDLDHMGHLLYDDHQYEAAIQHYKDILQLQPDSSVLHNNLGNVLYAQHRCDEASKEYREALRLQPDLPDAHHNLANCLLVTQKTDEAVAEYQQTLDLDPTKYQSRMMMAAALLQKGEINSGMEQLQQILAVQPENAQVRMLLGHAYYLNKDYGSSITELKHALSIQPELPYAENELAWTYLTAEDPSYRNPVDALRLAKHAVQTSPQPVPAILDTLAEALLQNGQPAEALKTEQLAVSLDPKNQEFQTRLAHFRDPSAQADSRKP